MKRLVFPRLSRRFFSTSAWVTVALNDRLLGAIRQLHTPLVTFLLPPPPNVLAPLKPISSFYFFSTLEFKHFLSLYLLHPSSFCPSPLSSDLPPPNSAHLLLLAPPCGTVGGWLPGSRRPLRLGSLPASTPPTVFVCIAPAVLSQGKEKYKISLSSEKKKKQPEVENVFLLKTKPDIATAAQLTQVPDCCII